MKKIFAVLMVVFFTVAQLGAQEPSFIKGSKVLNLGVGLGMLHIGSYYKTTVPPVSASFDIGIVDGILKKAAVGIGPYVGYSASKYEYSGYGWKYSDIILGVRGSFHYPFVDKLDTYAGVLVGYDISTSKDIGTPIGSPDGGHFVTSEFIGARYYFSEGFAAFAELGYGISWLTGGIALKF
ncbi:MAG: hypothetical protein NT092_07510 [Bacteroidia bacterium]|nr:hypothetical protein [Bacteroidia bacterium]